MKGYKAFGKGMVCAPNKDKPFQYEVGGVYEESEADVCRKGFHFCKKPLDVLNYYPLVDAEGNMSEFAEVEALEEPVTDDGEKYATRKIKIGKKLSFTDLVNASVSSESVKESEEKTTDKDYARIGSSGDGAQIGSSGYYAQIGSSGYYAQIGSSGDGAQIGSSGYYAQIGSSGNRARIGSSGNRARIGSSGDGAQIGSSGNGAQISSSGDGAQINSTGENSVICCAGNECIVKAKKGSWITLSEWKYDSEKERSVPVCVKTEYVDGKRIKEDTYYKLKDGEFVEVADA